MALTTNSDFASELVLNRIMNGQLKSDTGKTITAGGRATAAKFDATAHANAVVATNVSKGVTLAQGAVDAMTELAAKVKKLQELAGTASDDDEAQAYATSIKNDINNILNTTVDGIAVLGGSEKTVDLGLGSGSLTLKYELKPTSTTDSSNAFKALYNALANFTVANATPGATDTEGNSLDLCSPALEYLYQQIALAGSQVETLSNRYEMVNDLNTTYKTATDMQAVTGGGSASSLLSQII